MSRIVRAPIQIALAALTLAGCAAPRTVAEVPPGAEVVATVRHVAGPRPAADWIDRASLPAGTQLTDTSRALLLELRVEGEGAAALQPAPLELANLIVRIESVDPEQTVIAIQNLTDAALAFDLLASPDGRRFRRLPACPVPAGQVAYERWPEPMRWIAIGSVRVAGTPGDGCR